MLLVKPLRRRELVEELLVLAAVLELLLELRHLRLDLRDLVVQLLDLLHLLRLELRLGLCLPGSGQQPRPVRRARVYAVRCAPGGCRQDGRGGGQGEEFIFDLAY